MGALFQDGLADWTVGRNITLTLTLTSYIRVEAGSNTSTVSLRVVGGDERESLGPEKTTLARTSSIYKRQTGSTSRLTDWQTVRNVTLILTLIYE
jgi:hypothetical protein